MAVMDIYEYVIIRYICQILNFSREKLENDF